MKFTSFSAFDLGRQASEFNLSAANYPMLAVLAAPISASDRLNLEVPQDLHKFFHAAFRIQGEARSPAPPKSPADALGCSSLTCSLALVDLDPFAPEWVADGADVNLPRLVSVGRALSWPEVRLELELPP